MQYKPIKNKTMKTQKEFLQAINESPRWRKELKEASKRSDGAFYFTLGAAFDYFGVSKDFQNDAFIEKLMTIIN